MITDTNLFLTFPPMLFCHENTYFAFLCLLLPILLTCKILPLFLVGTSLHLWSVSSFKRSCLHYDHIFTEFSTLVTRSLDTGHITFMENVKWKESPEPASHQPEISSNSAVWHSFMLGSLPFFSSITPVNNCIFFMIFYSSNDE